MPDWKQAIRDRLKAAEFEPTREAEIVEELSQHLEDRYRELVSRGYSPPDANGVVLAELNESRLLARELRARRRLRLEPVILGTPRRRNMIGDLWQDLRRGDRSAGARYDCGLRDTGASRVKSRSDDVAPAGMRSAQW